MAIHSLFWRCDLGHLFKGDVFSQILHIQSDLLVPSAFQTFLIHSGMISHISYSIYTINLSCKHSGSIWLDINFNPTGPVERGSTNHFLPTNLTNNICFFQTWSCPFLDTLQCRVKLELPHFVHRMVQFLKSRED